MLNTEVIYSDKRPSKPASFFSADLQHHFVKNNKRKQENSKGRKSNCRMVLQAL